MKLRRLAQRVMNEPGFFVGQEECKVLVPSLYLRFGDRRNIRAMSGVLGRKLDGMSPELTRPICSVLGGFGGEELALVRSCAGRLLRNHMSEFVKMIDRIEKFTDVPGRFKIRINLSCDSITGREFVDIRTFLVVRLLSLCPNEKVGKWIKLKKANLLLRGLSDFHRRLVRRLWPK